MAPAYQGHTRRGHGDAGHGDAGLPHARGGQRAGHRRAAVQRDEWKGSGGAARALDVRALHAALRLVSAAVREAVQVPKAQPGQSVVCRNFVLGREAGRVVEPNLAGEGVALRGGIFVARGWAIA